MLLAPQLHELSGQGCTYLFDAEKPCSSLRVVLTSWELSLLEEPLEAGFFLGVCFVLQLEKRVIRPGSPFLELNLDMSFAKISNSNKNK